MNKTQAIENQNFVLRNYKCITNSKLKGYYFGCIVNHYKCGSFKILWNRYSLFINKILKNYKKYSDSLKQFI